MLHGWTYSNVDPTNDTMNRIYTLIYIAYHCIPWSPWKLIHFDHLTNKKFPRKTPNPRIRHRELEQRPVWGKQERLVERGHQPGHHRVRLLNLRGLDLAVSEKPSRLQDAFFSGHVYIYIIIYIVYIYIYI